MPLRVELAGRVAIRPQPGDEGAQAGAATGETAPPGGLARLAFAYLVSERERPVARDELAEALWGYDLPRTWETSLRVTVSKLRTWLAAAGLDRANALTSAYGTYQLHLPPDTVVDVEEAAAQLEAARRALAAGDASKARRLAAGAAAIAAADFLPGAVGTWVERRQAELRELRVAALEAVADAHVAMSEPGLALAAAEEAVALEPLRESAHLRVMAAHAAGGNRGAALRAYERLREALVEELGVSPSPQTDAAYLALLEDETSPPPPAAPPAATRAAVRWSLPAPVSTFVGRDAEVAAVAEAVASSRLVTLTGTGGLGKTRLAIEVGRRLAGRFGDGAAWIPLGDVSAPASVAPTALAALGLAEEPGRSPLATLASALADRHALLVVDNCEHVVDAAAELVAAVLTASPAASVLATSREPLRVSGEAVWPVPPLGPGDSARLFVERAAAADPASAPGPPASAALEEVCRRLEGIPLAIELAAVRAQVLSLAEIAERLDDRFRLLTGGPRSAPARHRTLRAAVDWTYDSLPGPERTLFRRLSVFAGSFTREAAAAVAGSGEGPMELLDLLAALVARSLVSVERTGSGTRYRLLDTLRAYAGEKLQEAGEATAGRSRVLAWAAGLAEEAERHLDGAEQVAWLDRLEAEHANLLGALAWGGAAGDGGNGADRSVTLDRVRLATALGRFWEMRGHLHEGRSWLRDVLAGTDELPDRLRARAHNALALLAQRQGDYAAARSRLEESLAIRRREGDRLGVALTLHGLGNLAALQHDPATARELYDECLAIGRELGQPALAAAALDNLGWVAHTTGDFPSAAAFYEEALALRRELGDAHGTALVLGHLGDLAYQQGDYRRAAAAHGQSLELRSRLGDRAGRADALGTLGHLALHDGDIATARARFEESLALRRELGDRAALPAALTNLGDLALVAGDAAAAASRLEEAAAVAAEDRNGPVLAHVLVHRARIDRLEGHPDQAMARYGEARRAAGALGPTALAAEWLEGVGAALAAGGDPERGARLLGAADALRETIGAAVPPYEQAGHERDLAGVRRALGDDAFATAWAEGRSLSLEDALAAAGV